MPAETTATFAGIHNENEFYSQHYLSEIFTGDIRGTIARWREAAEADGGASDGARTPNDALRALARDYLQFRHQFARERRHEARVARQRRWFGQLLDALGFEHAPHNHVLDDGDEVPVLFAGRQHGSVGLLVLGAYDAAGEDEDPLALRPHPAQYHGEAPPPEALLRESWADIVTRRIFGQSHPPRWIILVSAGQVLLIERGKWTHNRLLRFVLDDVLGRREDHTLKATAALLHRECLLPEQGASLLDSLDDNSHKHAFAVSEDLKYALRESIELIGNEAIRYLREVSRDRVYRLDDALAGDLGLQCLRYMYRLLFLFYIEARPDLGYAPIDAEAYRKGYGLERLRDLEMVRLTSEESLNGYYLHHSIQALFRLIRDGFEVTGGDLLASGGARSHGFSIRALDSRLFRADAMPLLDRVKLRNRVLQKVILLMSLSRPARGRRGRRGRISYAQLGINQLGAVYEALLSYRGFFAEEDLYEVKKAGDDPDALASAWFVPARDLGEYRDEEKVYDRDEQGKRKLRVHPKGSFVYRLAGRDRQKTASYYTPESLTRCVVKYALKELIPDDMPADRILELTVCEPAMGSAAFLNEAVNQLSEKYLERRQGELGKRIPHGQYGDELQKVRHYIADRNVYGVDLNPVALELAEVSLWLNSIHKDGRVPWFGYQLMCGNSLVGARRQVYETAQLGKENRRPDLWFNHAPERVALPGVTAGSSPETTAAENNEEHREGTETPRRDTADEQATRVRRPSGTVYHFLLPDPGMADYRDKAARELEPANMERIKRWRRDFCKPVTPEQIRELESLSDRVDELWAAHAEQLARDHRETEDTLPVWGQPVPARERRTSNTWKDRIRAQGIFSERTRTASPYRRLKLVMDYWCALWFWPIAAAAQLPDRDEFLNEIALVLTGSVYQPDLGPNQTVDLFGKEYAEHAADIAKRITNEIGMLDLDRVFEQFPRLKFVDELARRHRFHHSELAFADQFYGKVPDGRLRGGFDLVLGNPPWVKVEWEEAQVLGDYSPLIYLHKLTAAKVRALRDDAFLRNADLQRAWMEEMEEAEATQTYLNAKQNYPLLVGQQANLYKCFLPQAWMIMSGSGANGFLHPEGVYDDPKGGDFRTALYPRLRAHFQFQNEKNIFIEPDHHTLFSVNVYSKPLPSPQFEHIANLFLPATVDECLAHEGNGPIPGIKDVNNNWNTVGHASRLLRIDERSLAMFARIYDEPQTRVLAARLPALHTREVLSILEKFSDYTWRLGEQEDVYINYDWRETKSQSDGTIRRETTFANDLDQWVVSGPHYFLGNPLNKTPRQKCITNSDYDVLDLTSLPSDYLPRTNFLPACGISLYLKRKPRIRWKEQSENDSQPATDFFRVVNRRMVGSTLERTYVSALIPKKDAVIHTSVATVFRHVQQCVDFLALSLSVVLDFFIKTTGASEVNVSLLNRLPVLTDDCHPVIRAALWLRTLCLSCLTRPYTEVWQKICGASLPVGFRGDESLYSIGNTPSADSSNRALEPQEPPSGSRLFGSTLVGQVRNERLFHSHGFVPSKQNQERPSGHSPSNESLLYIDVFREDDWTKPDFRLLQAQFSSLTVEWHRDVAFRSDFARRQALVEIDVLASMALGLTMDELFSIYRVQFPIMQRYEEDTWYDTNGRIVFTASRGLPGVGLPRKAVRGETAYGLRTPDIDQSDIALGWEDIRHLTAGTVTRRIIDDTLPSGPIERTIEYHAPFDRCDREDDYRAAWSAFHRRVGGDSQNTY